MLKRSLAKKAQSLSAQYTTGALMVWMLFGVSFLVNAYIARHLFSSNPATADISAMIGAIVLMVPILVMAIKDMLSAEFHMSGLVAIAVMAAFVQGEYQICGIVSFLMLAAIVIQTRTAEGAHASIESLIRLTPDNACRLSPDNTEETVLIDELKVGDNLRVRPGEVIPVDGTIAEGNTTLNEATITGESFPVDKSFQDSVFAGSHNLTGVITVEVTHIHEDTTLGRVRELILAAEKTRLPITQIVDRFVSVYIPIVLMIVVLVWAFTGEISRVIAMLVISCPCALVLATPTVMVAALSACARLGILVKNVADLESASRLDAFIFDKTGTLTAGKLSVGRLAPYDGIAPADLLFFAASAEQFSNHPIARALMVLSDEVGVHVEKSDDFNEKPGYGVSATVSGNRVIAGREQWLKENNISLPLLKQSEREEQDNFSILWVSRNEKCVGWIGFEDDVRECAKPCLHELIGLNIKRNVMITGDRTSVAKRVAKEISCSDVRAQCLPQEKVDVVNEVKKEGYHVAVVGDGINDAPALASGDIGIAMGAAGSDVAIHSASIALMNNDLLRLPFLVSLSRKARTIIYQNLASGVVLMAGGLVLAGFGMLNPVIAAILHNLGALAIIFNSARLIRSGEHLETDSTQQ